jgi:senataxin
VSGSFILHVLLAEVTTKLHNSFSQLSQLPEGLHWFCPRCGEDDAGLFFDEDLGGEPDTTDAEAEAMRQSKLTEAEARKQLVLEALPIFAFDGADAAEHQRWLKGHLNNLMATCDICVRIYHGARRELKQNLDAIYEEGQVASFMDVFDKLNVERITTGLSLAEAQLLSLPEEKRRVGALSSQGVYAIFEVLSCEPFLQNEQLLAAHFDVPFRLVQSKRQIRLNTYLPALTYFLFGRNELRFNWAMWIWGTMNGSLPDKTKKQPTRRPPTEREFEWFIRPAFLEIMKKVQMSSLQVSFLDPFWNSAETIIPLLNKHIITHSLRSMEPNIYKLALEHFSLSELKPNTLRFLLSTVKALLELSPADFWDSMKTISPATIVEQFFKCQALEPALLYPGHEGVPKLEEDMLAWIKPFLNSIKPLNQTPACRSLVNQLIGRAHDSKYSAATKSICLTHALRVLQWTLTNLNQGNTVNTFVGPACVADMLELVNQYIDTILISVRGVKVGDSPSINATLALQIIELSLGLDSLALIMDREIVLRHKFREKANGIKSEALWNTIAKNIKPGNQALATSALVGAQKLLGLEPFGPKFNSPSPEDPKLFNNAYEAKCTFVCNILERLSYFQPFELAGFFKNTASASGIVATLLSSHDATRQGAIEVLERLSEKSGRRDAIGHLMQSAYVSTLSAINSYVLLVTQKKIFSPVSSMIKLCSDLVDVLTNSQDGVLRARDFSDEDLKVTEEFWRGTWLALIVVFDTTERWSTVGHDKTIMMDFCRDTMQFAEALFDGYSVFVSALRDELKEESQNKTHATELLRMPRDTMNSMVKWLRLRDEYLLDKIVKVVSNLLTRLKAAKMEASKATLETVENVTRGATKTKLTFSHINELVQALEKHTGRPPPRPDSSMKKQASISGWATPGNTTRDTNTLLSSNKIIGDSDLSDDLSKIISPAAEKYKKLHELKKSTSLANAMAAKKLPPRSNVIDQEAFKSRRAIELEEKKKRDAAAIAKAKALRGELAGAGSALGGMATRGKDHAKGTGMMVSSDDEDSADDDDKLDEDMFGTAKGSSNQKKLNSKLKGTVPTGLIPVQRGPLKIRRQERSWKDMKARLKPDLSNLHKQILGWDYFHTGDFPPGPQRNKYTAVPNKFLHAASYKSTFEPLLILEAWQGLMKAREENAAKPYEIKIVTRSTVDSFLEVSSTLSHAENIEVSISEGDIILFSKAANPSAASNEPHCLARVAKVSRKKAVLEVLYRVVPGNKFMGSLNPGGSIHGVKVQSMTTLEREYGALVGLQYYDLQDQILRAEPSPLLNYNDKQLEPFMDVYKLNRAQAKAVKSALDNDAFTLIQG